MVADVDRIDLALSRRFEIALHRPCPAFHFPKRPQDFSARVENCRRVFFARERFFPRGQQGVGRFHPLRESGSAPKFATRFQT
jgi:hypothetical protein